MTDSNSDKMQLTPKEWNLLTQDLIKLSVQIESLRKN